MSIKLLKHVLEEEPKQLIQEAEEQNKQYPQYKRNWDDCVVGEIISQVKTKLGIAFVPGDRVLVHPRHDIAKGVKFVTCYSTRNQIDTSVKLSNVLLSAKDYEVCLNHLREED